MKLVLLSGGSGKRLWPLSNDSRSKQFLKVLLNSNQQAESMVQRMWRQIEASGLRSAAYISTNQAQVEIIQSQLGADIPVIVEPMRRDTFPAIALATTFLHSLEGVDRDEVVIVMPVDPFVEPLFFTKVQELEQAILHSGSNIGLLGVTPTHASTSYGYIIPDHETASTSNLPSPYMQVKQFAEKPTELVAKQLIEQKALWNCGVFAFRLGYMLDQLVNRGVSTQYTELIQQYEQLSKISFDYEIVEKAKQVIVIPYTGDWKDLGTWNTLTENMPTNQMGPGYISQDSTNTNIVNELGIPIVVVSLTDIVVAASPDGILVADKCASHRVKEIMKDDTQRSMFVERRWGWYRVVDRKQPSEEIEVLTKHLHILAGKNLSYQYHQNRREIWVVLAGAGECILNGNLTLLNPGDVREIPQGVMHGIKATTDLEIIEVQLGSKLEEADIVRIAMTWEDSLKHRVASEEG